MQNKIRSEFANAADLLARAGADADICQTIERIVGVTVGALRAQKKIMLCGNGGSAADAQHWAAELVSRFHFDRPGLAAIALTTDSSAITAIGNDYGYEKVFARQIEALGQPGDVLFAISTSGSSPNIIQAVKAARLKSITTVGFTGERGRDLAGLVDECIAIPSGSTPDIQLGHEVVGHTVCMLVEAAMFADAKNDKS